ncbi:cold-shock protein [Natronospirillum sp.]|uniref:cold-shock protein n=1 Tax=Natronospirillum sp. TaxID=2812955 RepID=UPI0025F9091F|nr:cold-shock protein [Natronospirillum sp.]
MMKVLVLVIRAAIGLVAALGILYGIAFWQGSPEAGVMGAEGFWPALLTTWFVVVLAQIAVLFLPLEAVVDTREEGIVKWFNGAKGFGFITRDNEEDVFVHFRSIRGRGHRTLHEGQRVRFGVVESEKGLQAEDVSVVRHS